MEISIPATVPAVRAARAARAAAPRIGAGVVLLGTLITLFGLSWDIQWHVEVGPDTFFTLSHLALYSGSAIAGVASLVIVLQSTAAQRAGRTFRGGGPGIRVLGGTFLAPIGYLIAGTGAALFLIYGLLDLWWHSIYGFDAVLNTPSHVALFLSVSITMVGSIVIFAADRDQWWGRAGLLVAISVLIVFGPLAFNGLQGLNLPVNPTLLGVMLCAPTLLVMGALLLGRGSAIAIAVVLGLMQAALWWFSPWATHVYAQAVGLPLRDALRGGPPQLPNLIPMFLIACAFVVEGFLALRRGGFLVPLTGLVAGLLGGAGRALQQALFNPIPPSTTQVLLLILLGAAVGVLAAYLGVRFAGLLRATSEEAR